MTLPTPGHDNPAWTSLRVSARLAIVRRSLDGMQEVKVAEGRLLWLLRDGRARTLREIAEELDLEQSTVNRQVHAALDSGALRRFRREGSAAWLVEASDEGRSRFGIELERQLRVHEQALAAIPPEQQEGFLRHFEAYVAALGEAAHQAVPR